MRLPIRNKGERPLTVFIELQCEEFEVPVDGEAIVRLTDGCPHSIDIQDGWITIWDEAGDASVEVISSAHKRVDDALRLVRVWLYGLGAEDEALLIEAAVERFELSVGYLAARQQVFQSFYRGFSNEGSAALDDNTLIECHAAGVTAARLNDAARKAKSFPELGCAPFDTDTARSAFARALSNVR